MKKPILQTVKDFLSLHYQKGKPVLLAYSGGVDSTALFSLLLDSELLIASDLIVAHFDHAWREESKQEAFELQRAVESLGLRFYVQRSTQDIRNESNKEEKSRIERYLFLKKIYEIVGAQALVLAHQQEDLAETVLKRLFEGAGVLSLGGMQPLSVYEGMVLWRPLLSVSRKALEEWNTKKRCVPLLDSTNQDLRFLRARMRRKIFPDLEKEFGKSIQKNMALLGEEFSFLKKYIEKKLEPFFAKVIDGPLGFAVLSDLFSLQEPFEKRQFIRLCLQKKGVCIGREALEKVVDLAESGVFDKRVDVSKGKLIVDGGSIFWLCEASEDFWEWEKTTQRIQAPTTVLEDFLHGRVFYNLSFEEEVFFCGYSSLSPSEKKKAASFFSRNKIPAGMRKFFPFIKKKESIVLDSFLFSNDLFIEKSKVILTIKLKNISN